jgi:hypothetical protein
VIVQHVWSDKELTEKLRAATASEPASGSNGSKDSKDSEGKGAKTESDRKPVAMPSASH